MSAMQQDTKTPVQRDPIGTAPADPGSWLMF
jgi:hypothetical protein